MNKRMNEEEGKALPYSRMTTTTCRRNDGNRKSQSDNRHNGS